MIEEGFKANNSLLHGLDPRVKIVAVLVFSVFVAVSQRFVVLSSALVAGLAIVLLAKVGVKEIVRRLIPVNVFILFLWFFLPFTVKGHPVFSLGPFVATSEGLLYATQITLKSNAIVVALVALIASTPILTLGHAMQELRIPEKIVHLFLFTYRYIFVIHREYLRLMDAIRIRGFEPGTNMHTYKTFAYLVGMLLVRSSERADRVYSAMQCRGFRGRFYSLSEFSLKPVDVLCLGVTLTFILVLGVLEWTTMA
jgi:cobalt/nickel transport system permease protein